MSDTPRTDAFYASDCGGVHPTHARFARQLERELAEARKTLAYIAELITKGHEAHLKARQNYSQEFSTAGEIARAAIRVAKEDNT